MWLLMNLHVTIFFRASVVMYLFYCKLYIMFNVQHILFHGERMILLEMLAKIMDIDGCYLCLEFGFVLAPSRVEMAMNTVNS